MLLVTDTTGKERSDLSQFMAIPAVFDQIAAASPTIRAARHGGVTARILWK